MVNPIAGMGGAVALKGTDGADALKEAVARGATKVSPQRALAALRGLRRIEGIEFLTASGEMGAEELSSAGLSFRILHRAPDNGTSRDDTKSSVREFISVGAELVLFAGGDGTARDVVEAADRKIPILGIPTGVKMESAVFANSPDDVPHLLEAFRDSRATKEAEVLDVDEGAFRKGIVQARLFAVALVPDDPAHLQASKEAYHSGTAEDEAAEIGQYMADTMEAGVAYILGPGSTVAKIAEQIGQPKTLLGVDVYLDKKRVLEDAAEKELTALLKNHPRAAVVVSPIGAQGFFFGRGNQQISAAVLKQVGVEKVVVVATPTKLASTPVLRVDTGDASIDKRFRGKMKVVTGYRRRRLILVL